MSLERPRLIPVVCTIAVGLTVLTPAVPARAETGYDLWLRHAPVADASASAEYRKAATAIVVQDRGPTTELHRQAEDAAQWRDQILHYFRTQRQTPISPTSPAPRP